MQMPVKFRKIFSSLKEFEQKRSISSLIAVVGSKDCGKSALIEALGGGSVFVESGFKLSDNFDLIVVLLPVNEEPSIELMDFLKNLNKREKDHIIALTKIDVGSNLDNLLITLEKEKISFNNAVPVSARANLGMDDLKKKILENMDGHRISIAHKIPSFRKIVAQMVIDSTSKQNAIYSGLGILPGADMPVLTANQIKMVLELAAIYGEELTISRAKELMATIGGGYLLRAAARQLLDFVPGPGWIVKAGIAYSGTKSLGKAAVAYFGRLKSL